MRTTGREDDQHLKKMKSNGVASKRAQSPWRLAVGTCALKRKCCSRKSRDLRSRGVDIDAWLERCYDPPNRALYPEHIYLAPPSLNAVVS